MGCGGEIQRRQGGLNMNQRNFTVHPNTDLWINHIALEVTDLKELNAIKRRLEADGVKNIVGPLDHDEEFKKWLAERSRSREFAATWKVAQRQ
jgi:hypothetical protein